MDCVFTVGEAQDKTTLYTLYILHLYIFVNRIRVDLQEVIVVMVKSCMKNANWRNVDNRIVQAVQNSHNAVVKVGFHYPSSRPEFTGRVDGPRTLVHFFDR